MSCRALLSFCIITCLLHFGCNSVSNSEKENLKNDTFDLLPNDPLHIPAGIILDTIKKYQKENDYTKTSIIPRFRSKAFDSIDKKIYGEIQRLLQADTMIEKIDSSIKEVTGVMEQAVPLNLYTSEKFVSFSFEKSITDPGSMRPLRTYFSINYDIDKKQFIYFDDYFTVSDSADSMAIKWLIFGDIGNPDVSLYAVGDHICFSFDKDNVYFYFDMFGNLQNPMGIEKAVKKKYLYKFIRKQYKQ